MSRLHKNIKLPLIKKYYLIMSLLIIYGCYKNGLVPYLKHYQSVVKLIIIISIPFISLLIGSLFDRFYKNNALFNNKFYALLFSMIIPVNTNIIIYIMYLIAILFIYNFLISKNKNCDINFISISKILLVGLLFIIHKYSYQNSLELSGMFQYSFFDKILGHNIGGLFSTSIILIILSLIILFMDNYYKKEIPLYSYGIYVITLVSYAIFKNNLSLILNYLFSSSILFALVFIAPLSMFSPYLKKDKLIYSLIIGFTTLLFSLKINFYEGVYISIILADLILIFKNYLKNSNFKVKKIK